MITVVQRYLLWLVLIAFGATSSCKSDKNSDPVPQKQPPVSENLAITKVTFEKDKNPDLPLTIEATKIVDHEKRQDGTIYHSTIYLLVPVGTDFSHLTPSISYQAASLSYNVGEGFKPYPADGMVVDFKYPKTFQLKVASKDASQQKIYDVIVDVKEPIKFEQSFIRTPNAKKGVLTSSGSYWINQGNHPILNGIKIGRAYFPNAVEISTYTDVIYPSGASSIHHLVSLQGEEDGKDILPGEKGAVVNIIWTSAIAGVYQKTALITPVFEFETGKITSPNLWASPYDSIFDSQSFTIQTVVEE